MTWIWQNLNFDSFWPSALHSALHELRVDPIRKVFLIKAYPRVHTHSFWMLELAYYEFAQLFLVVFKRRGTSDTKKLAFLDIFHLILKFFIIAIDFEEFPVGRSTIAYQS